MAAHMTHTRSVAVVLLALAGCSHPAPPAEKPYAPDPARIAAVKAEREASTDAYVSCLMQAAKRLDDHRSDAATIGQAALAACATESQQVVEVYSRGLGFQGEETLAAKLQSGALGSAIEIVLKTRQTATSPAVADPVELGVEAARRGDYATALRLWRPLADQGNADAQVGLGILYYDGHGVSQDYAEAARWYRKAADQGDATAQYGLGILYDDGHGVSQDYAKAAFWFRKAADQGDAYAQSRLGGLYESGHGVSQDYAEAARWYRKAADHGVAGAQAMLGMLYEDGHGVAQDYTEAARWYRKAADQGIAEVRGILGAMYYLGEGVPKDYVQAYMWLNLAVAGGENSEAHYRDLVALSMTPKQIAEAQQRTAAWQKAHAGQ